MSEQLRVGQVIYVILSKDRKVYPMLIVEEVTKRSLGADVVTQYIAKVGTGTDRVVVSEIQGQIYHSPAAARDALIAGVTTTINKMVAQATQKALEWYPEASRPSGAIPPELPSLSDDSVVPDDRQEVLVDLGDGRVARVKQ